MKRLIPIVFIVLLLCGCSLFGSENYVVVEPHDEGYEIAIDSNAVTVSNYLGLKNAITNMVEEGVTDGVIRAENYSDDVTEDVGSAVYEVWRGDPLGAFAVDYMTYDCSKIVNYYEIHIHATYRRTPEDISSVEYVSGEEGVLQKLRRTMSQYGEIMRIRINDYEDMDFNSLVEQVFRENPDFAIELPSVSVYSYPESGSQRILEVTFQYTTPRETLLEMQTEMLDTLDFLVNLYGSNNDDFTSVRRLHNRIIRDVVLTKMTETGPGYADSVYGVLVQDTGSGFGLAQTYHLALQRKGIPCEVVQVDYKGEIRYVCGVQMDDQLYYVDLVQGLLEPDHDFFLYTEADLIWLGYVFMK